ncbi:MAG: hypothetical protein ABEK17_00915, partial [Candidatus Aenigmatarchaeota archaeon]
LSFLNFFSSNWNKMFGFKLKERHKKWLRNNIPCEICGSKPPNEIHRLNRGSNNGDYVLRNIQIVCNRHHKLIHYKEKGNNKK